MENREGFTTVYTASGELEAKIVQGRLESEGIPSILSYESAGVVFGLTIDGLGQVDIKVSNSIAIQARKILEENWD